MEKLKWLVMLLVFGFVFIGATNVMAAENQIDKEHMKNTKNEFILFDEKKQKYFDTRDNGYIDEVYKVEDGEIVEAVPVAEYVELEEAPPIVMKQDKKAKDDTISTMSPTYSYIYFEDSNYETRLYGSRSSIVQENPGPGSDTFTIAYSTSYTRSMNIGLSYGQESALASGVSYNYVRSESISSSHAMTIPAGYSGYWRFDPEVRKTRGTIKEYLHGQYYSSEYVQGYYPKRVGSVLDGYLVAVKTPL